MLLRYLIICLFGICFLPAMRDVVRGMNQSIGQPILPGEMRQVSRRKVMP